MADTVKITVYDGKGKVKKEVEARELDLEFGAIRSMMELLNIESVENTKTLMKLIYESWDQLVLILNNCFPDMEYEDWNHVKLKELIPAVIQIITYSFGEILTIPQSKNANRG